MTFPDEHSGDGLKHDFFAAGKTVIIMDVQNFHGIPHLNERFSERVKTTATGLWTVTIIPGRNRRPLLRFSDLGFIRPGGRL